MSLSSTMIFVDGKLQGRLKMLGELDTYFGTVRARIDVPPHLIVEQRLDVYVIEHGVFTHQLYSKDQPQVQSEKRWRSAGYTGPDEFIYYIEVTNG